MTLSIFSRNQLSLLRSSLLRSSLLFAAIGTGALALSVGLVWRVMERENTDFVQQSIGDTTALLSMQAQMEVDRISSSLVEIGQDRLRALQAEQNSMETGLSQGPASSLTTLAAAAAVFTSSYHIGTLEADEKISDLSLWRKSEPDDEAERTYLAVNSKFRAQTPISVPKLEALEAAERARLDLAFRGHAVVLAADESIQPFGVTAWVAVPLGQGEVTEVVAAHVRFDNLAKFYSNEAFVQAWLVDRDGVALAHYNPAQTGKRQGMIAGPFASLFELARSNSLESGQQALKDENDDPYFAGFRRVRSGNLMVVASVPAAQAAAALHSVRNHLFFYLTLVFLAITMGSYAHLRRRKSVAPENSSEEATGATSAQVGTFVAIHGTLRGFNQILEADGPEDTVEALNDYLNLTSARVREQQGRFEVYPGASFIATWDSEQVANSLRCAQALLLDLAYLNESRKLDGKKALVQGLGMHLGSALLSRVGPVGAGRECVMGEATACARALDRIGLSSGKELLISHDVMKAARGRFVGTAEGEVKLTEEKGLTAYYAIQYFEASDLTGEGSVLDAPLNILSPMEDVAASHDRMTGGETRLEILAPSFVVQRWMVNNGSQMVGPYTAQELAERLFSQELDFDCECWDEQSGKSGEIRNAGIFSGSHDEGARMWVYDGHMIHGPVSEGFLRTAWEHDAVGEDAFVCEGSTIQGWKRISEYLAIELQERQDSDKLAA